MGGAVPVATIAALVRLKMVGVPVPSAALIIPVMLVDGMAAGASEIMNPVGIVALAVTVASPSRLQPVMPIVSGAPTLSVKVTEAAPEHEKGLASAVFAKSVKPMPVTLYVLLVGVLAAGIIVWFNLAVAITCVPFSMRVSVPLTRLKVPVMV